jgi:hypothetical protein
MFMADALSASSTLGELIFGKDWWKKNFPERGPDMNALKLQQMYLRHQGDYLFIISCFNLEFNRWLQETPLAHYLCGLIQSSFLEMTLLTPNSLQRRSIFQSAALPPLLVMAASGQSTLI